MASYFALIVFGVATVIWGSWLLPRQLSAARAKMPPERQQWFDDFLHRRGVRWFFATPAVCGGLAIIVGVVFLLA